MPFEPERDPLQAAQARALQRELADEDPAGDVDQRVLLDKQDAAADAQEKDKGKRPAPARDRPARQQKRRHALVQDAARPKPKQSKHSAMIIYRRLCCRHALKKDTLHIRVHVAAISIMITTFLLLGINMN